MKQDILSILMGEDNHITQSFASLDRVVHKSGAFREALTDRSSLL